MSGTAIVVPAVHPWFRSTSRMLKKPPVLASLVGLVGFLGTAYAHGSGSINML